MNARSLLMAFFALAPLQALAQAPAREPQTIRIFSTFPAGSSLAATTTQFSAALSERLGRQWKVEGVSSTGNLRTFMHSPTADLAVVSTSVLAQIGDAAQRALAVRDELGGFAVFDVPFFFHDLREAQAFQKSAPGEALLASVGQRGFVGLGYWNGGMTQFFGKPIQSVANLKGQKVRTTIAGDARTAFAGSGATATTIAGGEVAQALQAGAIDAVEFAPHYVVNDVVRVNGGAVSEVNFRPIVAIVIARREFWRTLTLEQQTIVLDEVTAAAQKATVQAIEYDQSALSNLDRNPNFHRVPILEVDRLALRKTTSAGAPFTNDGFFTVSREWLTQTTPPVQPTVTADAPTTRTVFYATDRKDEGNSNPALRYAAARGELSFGAANVTVGRNRPVAGDPDPDTKVNQLTPLVRQQFMEQLAAALTQSARKEVLIYVHGFRNSFVDAVSDAALLAADIKLDGSIAIFSWPSAALASEYWGDEEEVLASRGSFIEFLNAVRSTPGVGRLSIVTHSMGSRLVAEAMDWANGREGYPKGLVQHLVLAAPDIYVARFEQAARSFAVLAKRVTLYASDNDLALWCSNRIVHSKRRAGQGGDQIVVVAGVDTLDATPADPWPVWRWRPCASGHSYLTRNSSVLVDLHNLLTFDAAPSQRFRLQARQRGAMTYWMFQAAQ